MPIQVRTPDAFVCMRARESEGNGADFRPASADVLRVLEDTTSTLGRMTKSTGKQKGALSIL